MSDFSKLAKVLLSKNITEQTAPKPTVSFVMPHFRSAKTPKIRRFCSYAELISCVRTLHADFLFADLIIQSGFVEIEDELSFSCLDPTVDHPLHVESLSRTFQSYSSLAELRKYAGINYMPGVTTLTDSFPIIERCASFYEHCNQAANWLRMQMDCRSLFQSDASNADLITTLWIHTVSVANEEIKRQSTRPYSSTDTLHYEYGTAIRGTQAHGKLDMSISIGAFVLGLHQAKGVTEPGKQIFPTLARMVALREQTLRRYVKRYQSQGLTESQIKAVLDEFPSVGVTSTGRWWVFLMYKYDSEKQRWCASHSPWYQLHVSNVSVNDNKADLRFSAEGLLAKLVGAALMQWHHHVAVEAKLRELSSSSEKDS